MLPIVALTISVVGVVIVAALIFMVVNVLREGPSHGPEAERRWNWRPPLGSRAELSNWAAKVAETVTRNLVAERRNGATPTRLADEVLGGATFAINNAPVVAPESGSGQCRNHDLCRMGVTVPEVLAIADRLRANPQDAQRVHDRAVQNAQVLAATPETRLSCPLIDAAGVCVAHKYRPLACRANLPMAAGDDEQAQQLRTLARELGEGVEAGLSRGLTAAGLDGQIYELNSALAKALEVDNASERWAKGENVFSQCAPYKG